MVGSRQDVPASRPHTPDRPTVAPDIDAMPPARKHLTGPAVLLARPGQLLLCFAIFIGLATLVESTWFAEPEEDTVATVDAAVAVSPTVERALARSGIESKSPAAATPIAGPQARRGLKGLIDRVAAGGGKVPDEGDPTADAEDANGGDQAGDESGGDDDVQPIENLEAMAGFYDALKKTDRKETGAVTRVIHFGDSTIVADLVTGTVRRKLQERFGDAGHGWLLVGKPWDWYIHQNIRHSAADSWRLNRVTFNPMKDGRHGLGGVNARALGAGPWATFKTEDEGQTGRKLSRFQLFFHAHPKGGEVSIAVDDETVKTVSTQSETATDNVETVTFEDAPHTIKVRAEGGGEVRLYGVVLEREVPGVVYDSIGISGIRAKTMGRFDAKHFKGQLMARQPNLVIVNVGTNESEFEGMSMEEYAEDYAQLLTRIRAAVPDAACLVAAPPDRAKKDERGRLATTPMIPRIIEVQKKVAKAKGCAFWNTWEAMGGKNSMVAWFRHKPRLGSGDYTHLTAAGGEALGLLLFDALMAEYDETKEQKEVAP